jgi:hypothetical protein
MAHGSHTWPAPRRAAIQEHELAQPTGLETGEQRERVCGAKVGEGVHSKVVFPPYSLSVIPLIPHVLFAHLQPWRVQVRM